MDYWWVSPSLKSNIQSLAKYPTTNYTEIDGNNMAKFIDNQISVQIYLNWIWNGMKTQCYLSYWYSINGYEVRRNWQALGPHANLNTTRGECSLVRFFLFPYQLIVIPNTEILTKTCPGHPSWPHSYFEKSSCHCGCSTNDVTMNWNYNKYNPSFKTMATVTLQEINKFQSI